MKKNLVVFGIFALVIVTTAVSYAFFMYSRVGQTTTTITSGDIEFSFIEGEDASLANTFPVSDSVGAQDTTEEYTFTVNMKSSSASNKMNYNVYLIDANDDTQGTSYFTNEQIKFALVKNGTFVAGTSSSSGIKLSEIDGFTAGERHGEGLVLEDQEISANVTDEYKLRIWISDDVKYTNTDPETGQDEQTSVGKFNGYKYSLKVKVTSEMGNSIIINDLNINNKTITANLSDVNGLSAYAVTQSSTTPANDSDEWIEITSDTTKSNVKRTTDSLITIKSITYTVESNGTYYLHVRNKLNQISKKEFVINATAYKDESGANIPEISTGMIPVIYKDENWVKADTSNEWYNYDEQWWANAVTVSEENRQTYMRAEPGTSISMDDINTMWVWVPRYEYETITSTTATEIKVNFLTGTESNKTDNYITHPGFTFGSDQLTGIWVAKFEASSDTACIATSYDIDKGCDLTTLKVNVKPNVTSWRGIRISTADLNSRTMNTSGNIYGFIESEVDTHVMKNMEWGATAYLTQSKYGRCTNGKCTEVTKNSNSNNLTGYSTTSYSTSNGILASTTGNIYGIYDMSGGAWDCTMDVMKDNSSNNPMSGISEALNSGFEGKVYASGKYTNFLGREWPDGKYYDLYEFGTTNNDASAWARCKIGDATTETKGWYGDYANFADEEGPGFSYGGRATTSVNVGIFCFDRSGGYASIYNSFRPVLVQK